MLRLIHTQTVTGPLLIDDIDDGLPNKHTHRLGSTADPKAYKRDGYANEPKQACYIPRVKPTNSAVAGYVTLNETERVKLSQSNGKINGFFNAGLINIVSLVAGDLAAPTLVTADLDNPAVGDVTLTGTNFLSVLPEITSVHLFGAGVGDVTLTQAQIIAVPPGAVTNTSIIIDSTLVPGLAVGDSVTVTADAQTTAAVLVTP